MPWNSPFYFHHGYDTNLVFVLLITTTILHYNSPSTHCPSPLRFLTLTLSHPVTKKQGLELSVVNPNMKVVQQDPTIFCTGHKKSRFYLFTPREPDQTNLESDRDILNERPTREDIIDKPGKGSFFATDLEHLLRTCGVQRLLLGGAKKSAPCCDWRTRISRTIMLR